MKFIIAFALFFTIGAHASVAPVCETVTQDVNTPVPAQLKDAEIVTIDKDGKKSKVSANDFKVVPRKQQFKVTKQSQPCPPGETVVVEKVVEKDQALKNIISLEVNRSLRGFDSYNDTPNQVTSEEKFSPALGVMYQRNVFKNLYLGGRIDTHKSTGVLLGVGF